ncbi:hypothetical protein AJ79_01657 [Helicocarpus griseus UAMH5409]|uniref:Uncharacterized protein n=1 Tax=Helicocarpus griseus UAMH5409 TaxID=1447875 RepID=A0A2B7Y6B5_9EURO|nr:hypothetical protein AJ79_01657 [Helicocarpus griseus UAMH5409]
MASSVLGTAPATKQGSITGMSRRTLPAYGMLPLIGLWRVDLSGAAESAYDDASPIRVDRNRRARLVHLWSPAPTAMDGGRDGYIIRLIMHGHGAKLSLYAGSTCQPAEQCMAAAAAAAAAADIRVAIVDIIVVSCEQRKYYHSIYLDFNLQIIPASKQIRMQRQHQLTHIYTDHTDAVHNGSGRSRRVPGVSFIDVYALANSSSSSNNNNNGGDCHGSSAR